MSQPNLVPTLCSPLYSPLFFQLVASSLLMSIYTLYLTLLPISLVAFPSSFSAVSYYLYYLVLLQPYSEK